MDFKSLNNVVSNINPDDYDFNIISVGLVKYGKIMKLFKESKDLSTDMEFQKLYNGFYRIRRNDEWRKYYFTLMQQFRDEDITFEDIITAIYDNTGNIEASFASKLLATINSDYPIWDQYVLKNLGLNAIPQYMKNDLRLKKLIELYDKINEWYKDRINSELGKEEIAFFDSVYPKFKWLSSTKKIDFLLWSKRK